MDYMRIYELNNIFEDIPYMSKDEWEQTRILALHIAQKFCKKHLKTKDIMEFPWDKDEIKMQVSEEVLKRNEEFVKQMTQMLNSQPIAETESKS